MKIIKTTERKYYKYQYDSWTQPPQSVDGVMGRNSFAVETDSVFNSWKAYRAFDNNDSTSWHSAKVPCYLAWYNPIPLKISSINLIKTQKEITGTLQGSNDNVNWVDLASFTTIGTGSTITNSSNEAYFYHRLNISYSTYADAYGRYAVIYTMTINAQTRQIVEGTSSDYDFYRDINLYKTVQRTERKYFKYSTSSWTRPILTDSTGNGTVGASSFAVQASSESSSSYEAWRAMNDKYISGNYNWLSNGSDTTNWYEIYNEIPLNITNFHIYNYSATGSSAVPTAGKVQISDDGTTWTDIKSWTNSTTGARSQWDISLSSNTAYSKYYRILFTANYAGNNTLYGLNELQITATQKKVIEGTSSDYAFYVDVETYNILD